jgi:hypothetical protein
VQCLTKQSERESVARAKGTNSSVNLNFPVFLISLYSHTILHGRSCRYATFNSNRPLSHHIYPLAKGRGTARGSQRGGPLASRGGRHGGPQGPQPTLDKPKREAILDLSKYVNARIRVKFTGGREGMCVFFIKRRTQKKTPL